MKNMKNIIKKSCLLACPLKPWRNRGMVMLATLFAVNIVAMRMSEAGKKSLQSYIQKMQPQLQAQKEEQLQKEREGQYQSGKYFIYEQGTANGILVDAQMAKLNCKTIKAMVEDLGMEPNEIPLPSSADIIKLGFGLLDNTVDISEPSFAQLVDVANLFNFLDVSSDTFKTVLAEIKETIDKSDVENIASNEILKKLHPDLQKLIMTESTISCLKDCIAQKYTKDRGKSLVGHPWPVTAVAISPDGTKIISGCEHGTNNLILWDISDQNNIIHYDLVGHPWSILSVAFSPDSKHVISSSGTNNNSLFLWDISDLNNITHQTFGQGQDYFSSLAFSPDGKNVFSCGANFSVWDISNPDNITLHQQLLTIPALRGLRSVVFSPDGTLVAAIRLPDYNILTIFDVSGPESHEYQQVQKNFGKMHKLAFSSDGKSIATCGDKLILWDINNVNNITSNVLIDNVADLGIGMTIAAGGINCVLFSHDDKKIALGHNDGFILLDINDPNNRVVVDKFGIVFSMSFNLNDRQIVTGGRSGILVGKNLNLWTLLTDQEEALLKQIQNYNADQVRLIYQLCLQSSKKQTIELKKGSEEYKIFMTLPEDMQKLLTDLFLKKGWLSGWW
jgi:WD40 repeat protein